MKKISVILFLVVSIPLSSCDVLSQTMTSTQTGLTTDDVISGLKDALSVGATNSSNLLSQVNGYFGNAAIKILMPPEAQNVETKLRALGFGSQVDQAILSMNRAAEQAATKAAPIFLNAIKGMSIQDAFGILKGSKDSATKFLRKTTYTQLQTAFKPVISNALNQVNATKYWSDVFDTYNKIPFAKKVNPDLTDYVTGKALDGIFYQLAIEEGKIRTDPAAQVDDILKKVFGGAH